MNFNQLFNFFFINSKINTLLFLDAIELGNSYQDLCGEGTKAQTIYVKQIRRYLGLGFFLSFIPGTEPFKARKNLLSVITEMEAKIDALNDPVVSFLLTTPFSIFSRLAAGLAYLFEAGLSGFLKGKTKLNRLNPFLYIGVLLAVTFGLLALGVITLFDRHFPDFEFELSLYIIIPIGIIFGVASSIVGLAYLIVYVVTELALNTLSALLVDPIIFVFESIYQLITDWSVEFVHTPTKDYRQINRLLASLGEKTLYNARITKELTLIEAPKEDISRYEKQRESTFYTIYKETTLFSKWNKRIVSSHNLVENLIRFNYFFKDTLNKDVLSHTAKIGLESDFADEIEAQVRP